jgi:hypothetical protein
MSGRIYSINNGVPICPNCGSYCLRSDETNYNGVYCNKCKKFVFSEKYDDVHPVWIAYKKYMNKNRGYLMDLEKGSIKYFKERHKFLLFFKVLYFKIKKIRFKKKCSE